MSNYLIAPGGEAKHYNYKLNILFSKIGQAYCGGTRKDGIKYIMRGVHNASTTQVKMMLQNKKRLSNKRIDDGYVYKIHRNNYINYAKNILEAIQSDSDISCFVKERFVKDTNKSYFATILNDSITALNRLVLLGIGDDSYKASEILNDILGQDINI